ncbi:MAG: metalloprotease [Leeuwenhoekiella sp.]
MLLVFLIFGTAYGQNAIRIDAILDEETRTLSIEQQIVFENSSEDTLQTLYLNDWANSFASKRSMLAKRFEENYDRKFHLASLQERGATTIEKLTDINGKDLKYTRLPDRVDIIQIELDAPILPKSKKMVKLIYQLRVPDARFTSYGKLNNGDFNLRFWHIVPAVYNGGWQIYSNKNLNDLYQAPTDYEIYLEVNAEYSATSELNISSEVLNNGNKLFEINGKNRNHVNLYLRKDPKFISMEMNGFQLVTNIFDDRVIPERKVMLSKKIGGFLKNSLGQYPFEKLLITDLDYKENPVYGLNQLPAFLSPFPNDFLYELKILKTTINKYVDNTLFLNPRKERWVAGAIKVNLMMRYMDAFYPKLKLLGLLDRYWLVRQFTLSEVEFNDQFNLLYLHMARLNLDQPLTTSNDSLIKFNYNIAHDYKAGSGLDYLKEYLNDEAVEEAVQTYYSDHKLELTDAGVFKAILKEKAGKNIDWFFDDYVGSTKEIDYKIKSIKKSGDSLKVKMRNKRDAVVPIPISAFQGDSLTATKWIPGFTKDTTLTFAADEADRFVLNEDGTVPEINRRNNYKKVNPFLGINRPFRFKLFQDIEDPSKNQVFFMPVAEYNFYDGLQIGAKMYNKTLLSKPFSYKLEPQFGLKSKSLTGSLGFNYTQNLEEDNLYAIRYGFGYSTSSYAPDAFFRRFGPSLTFSFRTADLRSDKRQFLNISNVNVSRDPSRFITNTDPNYSLLRVQYANRSPGVINAFSWKTDFQLAHKFSKASLTAKYRRVFLNNRQFDLRLFAGTFLYNDTRSEGDFFSFALDRPTDYLFEYNYYGRSEDSGIFSQQLVMAEGGFKSMLDTQFGNQWLTTVNSSTTLWNFFHVYGDVGLVKNLGSPARFAYDSGIRASLVEDYFEIFFPVLSSNGWEIAQPEYDKRIRFIVTLDLRTLLNLFTRKWY